MLLETIRLHLRRLRHDPVARRRALTYVAAAAASGLLLRYARLRNNSHPAMQLLPISALLLAVEQGRVEEAVMSIGACSYRLNSGELCQSTLLPNDAKLLTTLLHRHAVQYRSAGPPGWRAAMVLLVPFAYLGACGWLLHRMTSDNGPFGSGGGPDGSEGGGANGLKVMSTGWDDIGGLPGVKAAVMEVVDVMQRPEHYARLGARCPKGVLLAGPPGTGKTLLARAVATEAGVPFLCCTGSDFVEVFVGRGARRVRNLFEEAARRAPCVLFIDELDALGTSRSGRSSVGGHEEHDQTLLMLLAMMDGIGSSPGVLVIAATNRPDALDPALTRPGRFDRVLHLELPDEEGRLAILRVHAAHTPLEAPERVLPHVAAATVGYSGAELANLVNEAAVGAVRAGESQVRGVHFDEALHSFSSTRAPRSASGAAAPPAAMEVDEKRMRACASLLQSAFSAVAGASSAAPGRSSSLIEENE